MALPQPTALVATPKAGSIARLYMVDDATTITSAHEIPLTSEDIGSKGSGEVASVRTHNAGMLYSKNGVAKSFSFTTHAGSDNANVAAVIAAADGSGDVAVMKFVILNADGSYDYGHCVVNDKSPVQAPDGIFGFLINCSVIGDGEFGANDAVLSVTIDQADSALTHPDTLQLTATVVVTGTAGDTVTWSSGTPGVATVNGSGLVTTVAAGTTIITATSVDDGTKTDTVTITVT